MRTMSGQSLLNFHFTILTPFWKTWWFISVASLFTLINNFVDLQKQTKQLKEEKERLQMEKNMLEMEQKALRLANESTLHF